MSPNTERLYRRALEGAGMLAGDADALPELEDLRRVVTAALPGGKPPQHVSSVEAWKEPIAKLLESGSTPTAIHDRLRLEQPSFAGSLSAVKRLCLRFGRERGVRPENVAIPVETAPGEVAQVDFGYVGRLLDPETRTLRKAWVFVLVLGHSRHMVCRLVFDQRVETWLACHADAFAELGGVPAVIVPDNLKAAVVRAAFGVGDTTTLNRSYRDCARHFGFQVDPTPVRAPEKKGKVESAVKYVKRNFFAARKDELDAGVLGRDLTRWTREIAGQRTHGTTRRRPLEVFTDVEQAALRTLPERAYVPTLWREARVHEDGHVLVERALYSVPWPLVGRKLLAYATPSSVVVLADDVRIAEHPRVRAGQRSTREEHLPPHRRDLRHRSQSYWEERADRIGPEVGAYVREVFAADDVLSQLRTVQQIVCHLERFPAARARAACERARFYASYGYPAIKAILQKALDQQPLPTAVVPASPLESPRFARDLRSLLAVADQEARHASH
jgi:transposase